MAFLYRLMVTRPETQSGFARALRRIFTWDFSRGAILWHCTEGKDRCGMTTALVLEALGVDRETILEDYLKTNLINLPKAAKVREKLLETHGEEVAEGAYRAYIADEKYIRAAWEEMGSDYIRGRLGITDEELEAFRKTILE